MKTRKEHIEDLIRKAIDDIQNGEKGKAVGKLHAALGNLHLLEEE